MSVKAFHKQERKNPESKRKKSPLSTAVFCFCIPPERWSSSPHTCLSGTQQVMQDSGQEETGPRWGEVFTIWREITGRRGSRSPTPAQQKHKRTIGLAVRGSQMTQSLYCVYRGFIFCAASGGRNFSFHVCLYASTLTTLSEFTKISAALRVHGDAGAPEFRALC